MSAVRKHLNKVRTASVLLVAGVAAAACSSAAGGHAGNGHPAPARRPAPAPAHHKATGSGGTAGASTAGTAGTAGSGGTAGTAVGASTPGSSTVGSSTAGDTTQPAAAHGVQAGAAQIPWSEVGTGWTLALWSEHPTSPRTLFLVDPAGGRYEILSGLPIGEGIASWYAGGRSALLTGHTGTGNGETVVTEIALDRGTVVHRFSWPGWGYVQVSGDGERMVYTTSLGTSTEARTSVAEVDLATGSVLAQFTSGAEGVKFTAPDGLAFLDNAEGGLFREAQDGTVEQAFPLRYAGGANYTGDFLESADGTTLVLGTTKGLAVVSNSGAVIGQLASPVAGGCSPMRWAGVGDVLARCSVQHGYTSTNTLWLMPTSGASPSFVGADTQYVSAAWQAGDTWYGQAEACGVAWIVRIGPNGEHDVEVPGTMSGTSQNIVGSDGDDLEVLVTLSCDSSQAQVRSGAGTSLLWFDPATDAETILLGPGLDGGVVDGAVAYSASDSPAED